MDEAICEAARQGDLNSVRRLHLNGADLHARDSEPLCRACANGHLDVVRYLHQNGVTLNVRNNEPLCVAAGDYTNPTSIDRAIDKNLRWIMQGAIVIVILTFPVALWYCTWRVTIALLVFGLYLNFAVVVGNSPLFRYAIYAIPVNLMCAYVGAAALISVLRDRYLKKFVTVKS